MNHPFDIVNEFEQAIADYAGATYGVAVDSCTNALFLSLVLVRLKQGIQTITLPSKTYVGVPHAVVNAGHKCTFDDYKWKGAYPLYYTNIIDSALRFSTNMHVHDSLYCISFHWQKHLRIGRGGMILLDNEEDYRLLRRMRCDGRTERVGPKDDNFDVPGYHCIMHPDDAARGLMLLSVTPDRNEDLLVPDYADLSKHKYFIEG